MAEKTTGRSCINHRDNAIRQIRRTSIRIKIQYINPIIRHVGTSSYKYNSLHMKTIGLPDMPKTALNNELSGSRLKNPPKKNLKTRIGKL